MWTNLRLLKQMKIAAVLFALFFCISFGDLRLAKGMSSPTIILKTVLFGFSCDF